MNHIINSLYSCLHWIVTSILWWLRKNIPTFISLLSLLSYITYKHLCCSVQITEFILLPSQSHRALLFWTSLSWANHLLDVPDSVFTGALSTCIKATVLGSVFTHLFFIWKYRDHTQNWQNNINHCEVKELIMNWFTVTKAATQANVKKGLTTSIMQCLDNLPNIKMNCRSKFWHKYTLKDKVFVIIVVWNLNAQP